MPDRLKVWSQNELVKLKQDMDRLFDDFCLDLSIPTPRRRAVDDLHFHEEGDRVVASLLLPAGMDSDNISLNVLEQQMVITGRVEVVEGTTRRRSLFRREVTLPCRITPEDVTASIEDGVLEITLPMSCNPHGQRIEITRK